jgi:amino acid transporter
MADKQEHFLRKAMGLIRSRSFMDVFIRAFFSINLMTLGLYTISQAYGFKGGIVPAIVVCVVTGLFSTRILFSASFDRLLPEEIAKVTPRTGTPFKALVFMIVPGLAVSVVYCLDLWSFASLTLVSTLVIAVTFLGTGIAAVLLPFTKKEVYQASPLATFGIGSVPLISVFGMIFCGSLGYLLYERLIDPKGLYGISYRNTTSIVDKIYGEIPVE